MNPKLEAVIRTHRESAALEKLVGVSPEFRQAIETAQVAARSDAAVLIAGETGTGKELFARAIHYVSARAASPFVPVNCGSLTDTLLEDELFGHERGAFTDAQLRRRGLIAQADTGTLFLDEVDTLSPRGQIALLRVLQDKVYRPLGSQQECYADVRFVAATNARLFDHVEAGTFRADLYYRLYVFAVSLPPLRERRDDILMLARHFLRKHASSDQLELPTLSADAQAALLAYPWPGNVRELESAMIRATRLCGPGPIESEHMALPAAHGRFGATCQASGPVTFQSLKLDAIHRFEQDYLKRLMHDARGNVTRAAQIAGKDRRDLGRLLKKHGLASTPHTGG